MMRVIANFVAIVFNKTQHMRYLLLTIILLNSVFSYAQKGKKEYYLLKVYHCASLQQVAHVEEYVGNKLKPFLKKHGVPVVGIYMPLANDTALDKKLMVWLPLADLNVLGKIEDAFGSIDPFGSDPLIHLDSFQNNAPYSRIESTLASAFKLHPRYSSNKSFERSADNIYEYRSYESATEDLHLRKVEMFNEGGEIDIFKRLDFNAIFYSRAIVGARMPNLIYMTSFKNMDERNNHWKAFGSDPKWKEISPMPKYAGSVSRNETILMKASKYSDL
jgi:NIPSNAP